MRVQKNYQKMLEATIAGLKEQNRVPTLLLAQLLRAVQLVLPRVSVAVFSYHRGLLQPQYLSGKKSIICGCRSSSG